MNVRVSPPVAGPMAVLVLAVALAFSGALFNGFVRIDDEALISRNPLVAEHSVRAVRTIFTSFDPELYVPLTMLSFNVEQALLGPSPWHVHLVNLLLHMGNVLLVFLLVRRWTVHPGVAWVGALLFAVHPLQAEAVLWASARKDLLAAGFFLAALLTFPQYETSSYSRRALASLGLFFLSLLSKVTFATLPILLMLDMRARGKIDRRTLLTLTLFFVLSGIFVLVGLVGKAERLGLLGFQDIALLAAKHIAFLVRAFVLPMGLSIAHPQLTPIAWYAPDILPALLACAALGILAIRFRKCPGLVEAVGFFLITLLPTFLSFQTAIGVSFATEKYAYIPLAGLCFLAADLLVSGLQRWPRARYAIILCITIACVLWTWKRVEVWRNTETLARDTVRAVPDWAPMYYELAFAYAQRGELASARAMYERGLAVHRRVNDAFRRRGAAELLAGDARGAVRDFGLADAKITNVTAAQSELARLRGLDDLSSRLHDDRSGL